VQYYFEVWATSATVGGIVICKTVTAHPTYIHMARGRPPVDLTRVLGGHLWPPYAISDGMFVSSEAQHLWQLNCGHVVFQTIDATWKNINRGIMLGRCYRCESGYKEHGPRQPRRQFDITTMSWHAQAAWQHMDACLTNMDIVGGTCLEPSDNTATGAYHGYAVEAKVLSAHSKLDIYVPLIRLVVEVDASSHDNWGQARKDGDVDDACVDNNINILRLHHTDLLEWGPAIECAMRMCMHGGQPRRMYTARHMLANNQLGWGGYIVPGGHMLP
jgi:hypothetical protein